MSRLTLYTLGLPRVELDGVPLEIRRRRAMAIFVYLAVTGRRQSRDTLATLFFPEHDQRQARAGLRRTLSRLRTALGEGWLDVDQETVCLHMETVTPSPAAPASAGQTFWLDVTAFQERLAACRSHDHPPEGVCPACLPLLAEAAALYRDDFLAGYSLRDSPAFDDWQSLQTQSLRDQLVSVLGRLAHGHGAQGEFEPAIAYARRLVEGAPWQESGHRQLMRLLAQSGQRGAALAQYEACRRALKKELDVEPEPETVRLCEQIRAGELAPETRRADVPSGGARGGSDGSTDNLPAGNLPPGNLPAAITPFVGRKRELGDLGRLLADPQVRLVTVVGPGGMGKTRLALEAAAAEVNHYSHGVWFVSLAALDAAEGIVPTVAQTLGLPLDGEREPRRRLLDYVRQKQMLLLLDNCEHLLAGGELFAEVLRDAPGVRLLATSRVRLGLQGETIFELAGMSCPPEGEIARERLSAYSAAALFLSTAQRVRSGWAPQGEETAHIARLCRQVQGMPLALLLAAAWIDTLSPADIAHQVEQDLGFLETEWRDVPARQRSMRAVCDASWRLLTEREQAAFAALALFRGGFTAQAAQEVAGAGVRTLRSLVHKSFLQVDRQRYEVHELLRQYAQEKLDRSPDGGQGARERHKDYFVAALERWAEELKGPGQREALDEMEVEQGNLRAAWEWAVERGRWAGVEQAVEPLARFYDARGRVTEARSLFRQAAERLSTLIGERTLASPQEVRTLIALLAWQAPFEPDEQACVRLGQRCQNLLALPQLTGQDVRRQKALVLHMFARALAGREPARARALLQESLLLYRALGNRWGKARVLWTLGGVEFDDGNLQDAGQLWEQSLALFRTQGAQRGIAVCLFELHLAYGWQGRFEEAEQIVEERMALAREWGDLASLTQAHLMLGSIRYIAGCFAEAVELMEREYMSLLIDLGNRAQWAWWTAWLGHAKLDYGDYEAGRADAERSLAVSREANNRWSIIAGLPVLAMHALLGERYEEACRLYRETLDLAGEIAAPLLWMLYGGEWAVAELRSGRRNAARQRLGTALRAVRGEKSSTMPIKLLPPAALWLAVEGQAERAVEVYALARRYPFIANSRWYQDVFGPPIAAAAGSLPAETVQAARERGLARDLHATLRELLAELKE